LAKWTETWWEAPMEGSVLSFLKAEWKVSDTGSAHWASSLSLKVFFFIDFQLMYSEWLVEVPEDVAAMFVNGSKRNEQSL
jgi:hypothetical protein